MSAGLPGLGLGGIFFVLSALLAPLFELGRTVAGRSSPAAWRQVGRQFAIAAAMVVAVCLAMRAAVLPLAPLGLTTALMLCVLLSAKGLQLALRMTRWRRVRGRRRKTGGAARIAVQVMRLRREGG
jgi:hypothetical protein